MTPKEFAKLIDRDGYCLDCGATEALAPNHRANRGMGGSKKRNHPANYVLLCSLMNGLIESDQRWADLAISYGWKLKPWDDPKASPVFDSITGSWYLLNDEWEREPWQKPHTTI
jgi:hypothetical protein